VKQQSLLGRKFANFRIERLIGRGGMAEVYYGMDVQLHRPVAIKVFDIHSKTSASQSKRFMQEARMMAQWRHNNIVQVYYAGDATGLFYYVMEFVDGYDLASIMSIYAEKNELMPFDDVLHIGDAIAGALDYAHEKGVIHRDVKPANVLIANDGRVVLSDFGLALNLSEKTQGEVFGSPHYISPEQARRSSDAVPQSDMYSLGVILYEILTGATPFNDPSPASLALQHITEPPPLPRSINPALSIEVENVLLKALEKNPIDRYQTGSQLIGALRDALASQPNLHPAKSTSLPPIPVGAPTVQRSKMSLQSFAHRGDVKEELERRTTKNHIPAVVMSPAKSLGWAKRLAPVLVILAMLLLGWRYYPLFIPGVANTASPTAILVSVVQSTATVMAQPIFQPTETETQIPPTLTSTSTATKTATPTSTETSTPTSIPSATASFEPTATITLTNGIKYPEGFLMTAFYNATSFYILDRGGASRSVSGFSFDRVNSDGTIQNNFAGWRWRDSFDVIQPNYCLSLEVYPTLISYLNPAECEKRILSNVQFGPSDPALFWIPQENSNEFRVLWLNDEITRCQIDAGACDFYVP